ncbi:unnamed protein product [Jaminaea pallidilutea]
MSSASDTKGRSPPNWEELAAKVAAAKTADPPRHPIDIDHKTITEVAVSYNEQCPNPRLRYLMQRLIPYIHDFAREVNLTADEWSMGLEFLTRTGQISSDVRHEFILLSDILGLSTLMDAMENAKPRGATEATVLGPFHTEDADLVPVGSNIVSEKSAGGAQPLIVRGFVRDTAGTPIPNATIETWEVDHTGHYDTQYADRTAPDCRGILRSRDNGEFWFKCIVPVPYPIPSDGPVGQLLGKLGRHVYRPSHIHLTCEAAGLEKLVTALYFDGDKYLHSDAVFGVKSSLVVKPTTITSPDELSRYGLKVSDNPALVEYDLILCTPAQAEQERIQRRQS